MQLAGSAGTASTTGSTAGSALLSWDAPTLDIDGSPVTALAGYHIYVGTEASNMTVQGTVSDATTTNFEVTGLGTGTYYFAVAAYNAYGVESALSNIGSKTF